MEQIAILEKFHLKSQESLNEDFEDEEFGEDGFVEQNDLDLGEDKEEEF
jgi:hypothetical protein